MKEERSTFRTGWMRFTIQRKTKQKVNKNINVTREQTAISLASHPYFKGTKLKVVK